MSDTRPVLALVLHLFGESSWTLSERETAWRRCHQPVFDAIERNERLRVGLVLGGELLPDWIENHPARIERVRRWVNDGRIELLATPMYEPVLSAIPERDGTSQLLAHALWIKRTFDARPEGAWLPYRVWDPGVPRILSRADLAWCLVDDAAIARHHPGKPDPWGTWWTERGGRAVKLLATDARAAEMSGRIPVADLLVYARGRAVQGAVTQFWAFPTQRFGLRSGGDAEADAAWLSAFLDGLNAAVHLDLQTPSLASDRAPARGRTYLPSCAPPDRDLPWERHLLGHPEADRLHKKMLRVSRQLARLQADVAAERPGDPRPDPEALVQATRYLHRGQGASAFRPGDDAARRSLCWRDLVRAEREVLKLRQAADRPVAELADLGTSGTKQVLLRTASLCAVIEPAFSGGLTELSAYDTAYNFMEPYSRRADDPLGEDLRPRASFVEHVADGVSEDQLQAFVDGLHARSPESHVVWDVASVERSDDGTVRCALVRDPAEAPHLTFGKSFVLRAGPRLDWTFEVTNRGEVPVASWVVVELTFSLGVACADTWIRIGEEVLPVESSPARAEVVEVEVCSGAVRLGLGFRRPARVLARSLRRTRPPASVPGSGDQGVVLYVVWAVELVPGEKDRIGAKIEVGTPRDA